MKKIIFLLLLLASQIAYSQDCDCGNLYTTGFIEHEGTGYLRFPLGTTAQRPGTPANGMMRYNSTTGKFEAYEAGSWKDVITSSISLSDPGADRLLGWDDSEGGIGYFNLSSGLSFSTTTLTLHPSLQSIAGLTTVADRMIYTTASDTYAVTPLTSFARTLLDDASEAAFKATTNLEIGIDVQAWDADLDSLSAFSGTGFPARTAVNTWAQRTITGTADRITITNGNGVSGNPVFDIASTYVGQTSITTLGTVTTGTWNADVIQAIYGGTGQSTVTTGDILYGSASNTWSRLAGVATGNALISGGVSTAPSWGKIGLDTHVSGNLPVTNLNSGTSASATTFWRGDGTWAVAPGTVDCGSLEIGISARAGEQLPGTGIDEARNPIMFTCENSGVQLTASSNQPVTYSWTGSVSGSLGTGGEIAAGTPETITLSTAECPAVTDTIALPFNFSAPSISVDQVPVAGGMLLSVRGADNSNEDYVNYYWTSSQFTGRRQGATILATSSGNYTVFAKNTLYGCSDDQIVAVSIPSSVDGLGADLINIDSLQADTLTTPYINSQTFLSIEADSLHLNSSKITGVADPVNSQDAVTLNYLQSNYGTSVTPSALTKNDDTNITLTLGGTPSTAVLQPVSVTAGWTGTLATARGGLGASWGATVADRFPYTSGIGTFSEGTVTAFGRSLIDDAAASNARTTLGLGSLAVLSTINNDNWSGTDLSVANGGTGASSFTDGGILYGNGTSAFSVTSAPAGADEFLVSTGAGTWGLESASSARTSLGLGTMATQNANSVNIDGGTIDGTTIGGTTPAAGTLTSLLVDGGVGVGTAGLLQVRQSGDTRDDGLSITSSFAISHRIWKDASGTLNFGTGSAQFSLATSAAATFSGSLSAGATTTTTMRNSSNAGTGDDIAYYDSDGDLTRSTLEISAIPTFSTSTFTPVVADASSGGNTATLSSSTGFYYKSGAMVFVHIECVGINITGMTGGAFLYIRNLPFSSSDDFILTARVSGTTYPESPVAEMSVSNSFFRIQESYSTSGYMIVSEASGGSIIITGLYHTSD